MRAWQDKTTTSNKTRGEIAIITRSNIIYIFPLWIFVILFVCCGNPDHKRTRNQPTDIAMIPKPADSTIAYNACGDGLNWHVRITNDFKTSVNVTGGQTFDVEPSWSPDKRYIAFIHESDLQLWKVCYDGSQKKRLSPDSLSCGTPRWSPDGNKLVFTGNYPEQEFSIYVIDSTGNNLIEVTDTRFLDKFSIRGAAFPDWSPDGKSLVFTFIKNNDQEGIGIINLEHQSFFSIPNIDSLAPGFPCWSPARDEILFNGTNPDFKTVCLYRVNLNGSGIACLTPEGGRDGDWSADGSKIVYTKLKIKEEEIISESIWRVNRDGSERKQLSPDSLGMGLPSW